MISLKEARQKVINILGEDQVPAHTTLRGWANKGVISGVIGGSTAKAKYPNFIVAEIVAAIQLHNEYTLKEIAEIRKKLGIDKGLSIKKLEQIIAKKRENHKNINKKLFEEDDQIINKVDDLMEEMKKNSAELQVARKYKKQLEKIK